MPAIWDAPKVETVAYWRRIVEELPPDHGREIRESIRKREQEERARIMALAVGKSWKGRLKLLGVQ